MNYDFNIEKIVFACFVVAGTGATVHKNRPSHGLAIHMQGDKEYHFSDGQILNVKAQDIIYLPKHSNYTVSAKTTGDCYAINFDFDEDVCFSPFVTKAKNFNAIVGYFHTAQKVWNQKKPGYVIKCKAELYNIIYAMHQEYFTEYLPKNKLDVIKPAIDYIHEKYTDEVINIETIAKICNISPEYFRRIFKSFYGVTPVNYINNLKITRVKELLGSQMYSVTDAARMSGFNEMSYFSREFKKVMGVSPSEYKKSAQ